MPIGRTFKLALEVGPYGAPDANGISDATRSITLAPPYTIEFDVRRAFLASAQTASFTITGLGEKTRNAIYKDRYALNQFAALQFWAGYRNEYMPQIFNGSMRWAYPERLSRTEMAMNIEAYDGGFAGANAFSSFTLAADSGLDDVLGRMNQDLANARANPQPIFGSLPIQTSLRPAAYFGPTMDLIQKTIPQGLNATIDNNQLMILAFNDALLIDGNAIFIINSQSGLLSPPIRAEAMVVVKMMFEPRLRLGQIVQLDSMENKIFNGLHKIMGIAHHGIISDSTGGDLVTELQLWLGTQALTQITVPAAA